MRKMLRVDSEQALEVCEHIILLNLWEYYVLNAETNTDDIKLCYVLGFENELGDVSMDEIAPYIISRTKDFSGVLPAPGFEWSA